MASKGSAWTRSVRWAWGLFVAARGEAEDGEGLAVGVDQPVVRDVVQGVDAALLDAVAAAGIGAGDDLAHPVGGDAQGVAPGALGQGGAAPAGEVGCTVSCRSSSMVTSVANHQPPGRGAVGLMRKARLQERGGA